MAYLDICRFPLYQMDFLKEVTEIVEAEKKKDAPFQYHVMDRYSHLVNESIMSTQNEIDKIAEFDITHNI